MRCELGAFMEENLMPTSSYLQLNEITQLMYQARPQSVLDIGVGFGKYGVLAREYLEFWGAAAEYDQWTRRIDGIEVFDKYLTPLHEYIYDNVYRGDARDILPKLTFTYDLILLIDVIEHFDLGEGMRMVDLCLKKGRNVIVATPKNTTAQEDAFGNPFERHRCQWEHRHFEQFSPRFSVPNSQSLIYLIGEVASKFAVEMRPV